MAARLGNTMTPRSIVIVGTGHAGFCAAETLRREGWDGDLTLIGEEQQAPYDRTAVSKGLLFAAADPASLGTVDADVRLGERVLAINRAGRRLTTARGDIAFEHLIIATGARPRGLAAIEGLPGVHMLRRASDALGLRVQVKAGARMLVIGGGLIGLEVAAGAVRAGMAVTVIETMPRLMARVLPQPVAARLAAVHATAGVDIRTDTRLVSLARDGDGLMASLDGGEVLLVDVAVIAIGVVPNTELAEAAGLVVDDGIVVDAALRTSDSAIAAIGDVCRTQLTMFGTTFRCESQQLAEEQGRYVARRLLGSDAPFAAVPWAWSDQYDQVVQVAGMPAVGAQMMTRDFEDEGVVTCHLTAEGRLVGLTGFGKPQRIAQEIGAGRRLVARQAQLSADELASTARSLRAFV